MEKIGLINEMTASVRLISEGRRGLSAQGKTEKGLRTFRKGHVAAMQLMKDAIASKDPETMLLAETVYLATELEEGLSGEQKAKRSADAAMRAFTDALSALRAAQNSNLYKGADMTFPHAPKYRVGKEKDMPKDAFHIAFASHVTRLNNGLTRFGIAQEDRELAIIRLQLVYAAQESYYELQKKTLQGA